MSQFTNGPDCPTGIRSDVRAVSFPGGRACSDRRATPTARVVAFASLYLLLNPDRSTDFRMFERLQSVEPGSGQCSGSRSHSIVPHAGATALPADYREQVRAVARRVAADVNEPRSVRGAAGCLM